MVANLLIPSFCRKYFDWLSNELKIKRKEDWYGVNIDNMSIKSMHKELVQLLNNYYNDSLCEALQMIYNDHKWFPFLFKHINSEYWIDKDNHRQYVDWLGDQLSIKNLDEWYNITADDVKNKGGKKLLQYYEDSVAKALQAVYPQHTFDPSRFIANTKISLSQKQLYDAIKEVFVVSSV